MDIIIKTNKLFFYFYILSLSNLYLMISYTLMVGSYQSHKFRFELGLEKIFKSLYTASFSDYVSLNVFNFRLCVVVKDLCINCLKNNKIDNPFKILNGVFVLKIKLSGIFVFFFLEKCHFCVQKKWYFPFKKKRREKIFALQFKKVMKKTRKILHQKLLKKCHFVYEL